MHPWNDISLYTDPIICIPQTQLSKETAQNNFVKQHQFGLTTVGKCVKSFVPCRGTQRGQNGLYVVVQIFLLEIFKPV